MNNRHLEWFERLDAVLAVETALLDELKLAINEGWLVPEEAEEALRDFHLAQKDVQQPLPDSLDSSHYTPPT